MLLTLELSSFMHAIFIEEKILPKATKFIMVDYYES